MLPAEIKPATFELFQTQYAALPMPPTVAAYLFTYAEFVLPVCLVLGFATRLSALALLAMTILIQVYVVPDALWTAHVYLFAILMVLMSVGPGAISLDALIRYVYRNSVEIGLRERRRGFVARLWHQLPEFRHVPPPRLAP